MKQALYSIAKEDLKASELLFNKGMLLHALYNSKQAIEKVWKALGTEANFIEEKDLKRNIGHNIIKIFKMIIQSELNSIESGKYTDLAKESNAVFDYKIHQKIIADSFHDCERFSKNNFQLNSSEQFEIIELLKNIENFPINTGINIDFQNKFEETIALFKIMGVFEGKEQLLDNEKYMTFIKQRLVELETVLPIYLKSVTTLFYIAMLFSSVIEDVRYPQSDKNNQPSSIYTVDHQIIKSFPDILSIFKNAISELDLYYNSKNKPFEFS